MYRNIIIIMRQRTRRSGIMVNELDWLTITSKFDSKWMFVNYSLVPILINYNEINVVKSSLIIFEIVINN